MFKSVGKRLAALFGLAAAGAAFGGGAMYDGPRTIVSRGGGIKTSRRPSLQKQHVRRRAGFHK